MGLEPLIGVVLAQLLLLAPGMALAAWLLPAPRRVLEVLFFGGCLGLAGPVVLAHLPMVGTGERLLWLWFGVGLMGVAGAALTRRRSAVEPAPKRGHSPLLAVTVALVFLFRLVAVSGAAFPPGWDPSFHSLLTLLVSRSESLPTEWAPFEAIPINYPLGSHVWMALTARLGEAPIPTAFALVFPLAAAGSALGLGLMAQRCFGGPVGPLAAGAYGFLADWGGWAYYSWGGVPNALACLLLVGACYGLIRLKGGRRVGVVAVLLAVTLLVHHLTALVAVFVVLSYPVAERILGGTLQGRGRAALYGVLLSGVLVAPYAIPYALKAGELSTTSVLRFDEEAAIAPWQVPQLFGIALCVLALAGLPIRRRVRRGEGLILHWLLALLVGFVLLDQGYRLGARWLYGEDFAAFTPSRWLTDVAYPLAILAGLGAWRLLARVPHRAARRVLPAVALLVMAASAIPTLLEQRGVASIPGELVTTYQAAGEALPPDAVVFDGFAWAPFLLQRETTVTPLPASEARLGQGPRAKRALTDLARFAHWAERAGRPGFAIVAPGQRIPPGVRLTRVQLLPRGVLVRVAPAGE